MGITRPCSRCSIGTETCAIGDFYVCDVCDAAENAARSEPEPDPEEETLDEPADASFGGYFSYALASLSSPIPEVGDLVESDGPSWARMSCTECGCMGAVQVDGAIHCPAPLHRTGFIQLSLYHQGQELRFAPYRKRPPGGWRWKRFS